MADGGGTFHLGVAPSPFEMAKSFGNRVRNATGSPNAPQRLPRGAGTQEATEGRTLDANGEERGYLKYAQEWAGKVNAQMRR